MAKSASHPFLDPLWRRVVLIVACAIWTVVEILYGTPMWATLVGAVTVYGAYTYIYTYKPSTEEPDEKG